MPVHDSIYGPEYKWPKDPIWWGFVAIIAIVAFLSQYKG